jgi:hypothetical protein
MNLDTILRERLKTEQTMTAALWYLKEVFVGKVDSSGSRAWEIQN